MSSTLPRSCQIALQSLAIERADGPISDPGIVDGIEGHIAAIRGQSLKSKDVRFPLYLLFYLLFALLLFSSRELFWSEKYQEFRTD